MTHYVCDGTCGGVAGEVGVCKDETCPMHGHPLKECNCTDGKHAEVLNKENKSE